jgi:hypothetical protein
VSRYTFRADVTIAIEADNIAHAWRLARKVRVIGSRLGSARPPKNRDRINYSIEAEMGPPVLERGRR